ncbi:MAG: PDZ domain-containing protein, partial [Planctomycetota bacterium]
MLSILFPRSTSLRPRAARPLAAATLGSLLLLSPAAGATLQDEDPERSADAPTAEGDAAPEREALPERPPVRTEGKLPIEWVDALEWRSIGPANMGGRITDIAVHPADPAERWLATATGGVLHTTNGGATYEHLFDAQRVSSIGAIAVAPSDPTQVWVGTGEPNPRNSVSWGDGVYASMDGGATWRWAGLGASFQISSIVVHPEDPDVVFVGALGRLWGPNDERGLYRTTDGGRSWERVLFVDEDTGVVEVKMHPTDPSTLLVATYQRRRDGFDTNDPAVKWGPGSGIWRTTDGGDTFERVSAGLPTGTLGRIGMSWCASEPDSVFAIVETERITQAPEDAAWFGIRFDASDFGASVRNVVDDSPAKAAGIAEGDVVLRIAETPIVDDERLTRTLRKYSAGDSVDVEVLRDGEVLALEITFDRRPSEEEKRDVHGRLREGPFGIGLGGQRANAQDDQGKDGFEFGGVFRSDDRGSSWTRVNSLNPRPMYYSEIRVDPSDADRVYVLGTRLYRSKDGGVTFTRDGHGRDVHVDHHALWIDPADGRHMVLGNDGGVYETRDRMENWQHHNRMALGQFYNVSVGPRDVYTVYGGLQDNGTWAGPSRTADAGPTNGDWFRVGGGDGFRAFADPEKPDRVYFESQNGGMARRDFETGEWRSIRPRGSSKERIRFNWNTPYLLSSFNSGIVYSAGSRVFRSVARGSEATAISPEITATDRGAAVALAESPRSAGVLWVGTDDGALWLTEDDGVTWTDLMALNGTPAFEPAAEPDEERARITAEAKAAVVATETPAPAPAAAPQEGGLGGEWKCRAKGEALRSGSTDGQFVLRLAQSESGRVTGTIESEIGSGELTRVRYRRSTGDLSFRFEVDRLALDFEGRADLDQGTIEGVVSAASGAIRFDFTGRRGGAKPAAAAKAEVASAGASSPAQTADDGDDEDEDDAKPGEEADDAPPADPIDDTLDQLLPGRRYVSDIEPSRFDGDRVYVTFDGHRSDDTLPHVFVSEDRGRTWDSLRSNLPDAAGSVRTIHEDRTNEDVLYVGTEHGIYVSIDRGDSWTRLNSNLPTVPVHDLAQHTGAGELVAATHGRSLWVLDVRAIGQMDAGALDAPATLFEPNDVRMFARMPERGSHGSHRFVGTNPSRAATFTYALGKKADAVVLEVRDASGEVVASVEGSGAKGLHRVEWNLRTETEAARSGRRRVRRARPGAYSVTLVVDGDA